MTTRTMMDPNTPGLTPLMKQYWEIKTEFRDEILFFRMGDFYEMFYEDAVIAAPILNIALTARNKKSADETPMCGVPHHSISQPISKLLQAGYKVAICDQLEDPATAKGIVKRGVTRVLSPGMVYDPETLNELRANYLASYDEQSVSFLDASSGEAFYYKFTRESERDHYLTLLKPVELVLTESQKRDLLLAKGRDSLDAAAPLFLAGEAVHLSVIEDEEGGSRLPLSARRLLAYVMKMQGRESLATLRPFVERHGHEIMSLPATVVRHLEIFETYRGDLKGSLFHAVNRTKTSAGARLLRSWLQFPLLNKKSIEARQARIAQWMNQPTELKTLRRALQSMGDIERRLSKISYSNCNVHDLLALEQSLQTGLSLTPFCPEMDPAVAHVTEKIAVRIRETLADDPPVQTKNGGFIRKGFSAQLDEWIDLADNSQKLLIELEAREKEQTGIPSLKIRYNNVFGYYIEVTNTHKDKVPDHYKRKQTLANAERYVTQELHELESKILSARTKRIELEEKIFADLRRTIMDAAPQLRQAADVWSTLDVISSLAFLALEQNYTRPVFSSDGSLELVDSRHPVIEQEVKKSFVPNTIRMKAGDALLLTGPNMAGKSTLMRQVAVLALLAQIGSFVPAKSATMPIFHRIFTRIGASDNLAEGLSTFMVEMTETAQMLAEADEKSLVVLDEVGRGTSTYDGMSLAQAILEYLVGEKRPLVLFATHYHELTQLEQKWPQIQNVHMAIQEKGRDIRFLYTLKKGPANKSYGIQVARLAGLPEAVTARAEELLREHESLNARGAGGAQKKAPQESWPEQLQLTFQEDLGPAHEIIEQLKQVSTQNMTPLQALIKLSEWQQRLS